MSDAGGGANLPGDLTAVKCVAGCDDVNFRQHGRIYRFWIDKWKYVNYVIYIFVLNYVIYIYVYIYICIKKNYYICIYIYIHICEGLLIGTHTTHLQDKFGDQDWRHLASCAAFSRSAICASLLSTPRRTIRGKGTIFVDAPLFLHCFGIPFFFINLFLQKKIASYS